MGTRRPVEQRALLPDAIFSCVIIAASYRAYTCVPTHLLLCPVHHRPSPPTCDSVVATQLDQI